MPKVDILVPAYNAERFLAAALDSVLTQTFSDWRIVLVDDGSQDGTAAIAQAYAARLGPRMLYLHQENRGLPASRNTAIRHSDAELLALLDADDLWLPNRLAESVKVFDHSRRVGLSYGFIDRIDQHGTILETFTNRSRRPEGRIAPYIYMRTMHLPCPTVTFRRQAVEQAGLFDESMRATEDRDLWLRIALHFDAAIVPVVIAQYRTSPQAMTTDPHRMFAAQKRFVDKHFGAPGCGRWARRVALSRIYRQRGEALAERGEISQARNSALHALALYPLDRQNLSAAASLLRRSL